MIMRRELVILTSPQPARSITLCIIEPVSGSLFYSDNFLGGARFPIEKGEALAETNNIAISTELGNYK